MGVKNSTLSKEDYTKQYEMLMKYSFKNNTIEWLSLLDRDRVTLVCYCRKGDFCHRVLLAKFLEDNFDGVKYMGEI